jgi:hypothetical protein
VGEILLSLRSNYDFAPKVKAFLGRYGGKLSLKSEADGPIESL